MCYESSAYVTWDVWCIMGDLWSEKCDACMLCDAWYVMCEGRSWEVWCMICVTQLRFWLTLLASVCWTCSGSGKSPLQPFGVVCRNSRLTSARKRVWHVTKIFIQSISSSVVADVTAECSCAHTSCKLHWRECTVWRLSIRYCVDVSLFVLPFYSLQDIVTDFRWRIGADLIHGHLSLEQHNETEKEQVHQSANFVVVLDDDDSCHEFGECCDVEEPELPDEKRVGQELGSLASSADKINKEMFSIIKQFRENRKNGLRKLALMKKEFYRTFFKLSGDWNCATLKKKCGKFWSCIEYAIFIFFLQPFRKNERKAQSKLVV